MTDVGDDLWESEDDQSTEFPLNPNTILRDPQGTTIHLSCHNLTIRIESHGGSWKLLYPLSDVGERNRPQQLEADVSVRLKKKGILRFLTDCIKKIYHSSISRKLCN